MPYDPSATSDPAVESVGANPDRRCSGVRAQGWLAPHHRNRMTAGFTVAYAVIAANEPRRSTGLVRSDAKRSRWSSILSGAGWIILSSVRRTLLWILACTISSSVTAYGMKICDLTFAGRTEVTTGTKIAWSARAPDDRIGAVHRRIVARTVIATAASDQSERQHHKAYLHGLRRAARFIPHRAR